MYTNVYTSSCYTIVNNVPMYSDACALQILYYGIKPTKGLCGNIELGIMTELTTVTSNGLKTANNVRIAAVCEMISLKLE